MKMVRPKLDAPTITIAQDQEEYLEVTAALVTNPLYGSQPGKHNTIVLCYRPTAEERERLAGSDDIYVSLLTFGGPMQPIIVSCGAAETAAMHNIGVAE